MVQRAKLDKAEVAYMGSKGLAHGETTKNLKEMSLFSSAKGSDGGVGEVN